MKILNKETLIDSPGIKIGMLEVLSPEIALKARPGQFIVLMASDKGERIPLTVVEKDLSKGTIKLIFQEAGLTTKKSSSVKVNTTWYIP